MKFFWYHQGMRILNNIDVMLGIVGVFFGGGVLFLSLIGQINQHFIGIILIFSSLIYLLIRSQIKENIIQNFHLSSHQKTLFNIIFFLLIIFTSVLWYNQLYTRSLIYFIIMCFISGLISIEIIFLTKEDNVWPILFKILFLAFVIRIGIYYNFPSIMGYDAYSHTNIANMISITGFVPPFQISDKYINYPILHIFISITNIISNINIKDAVFFSIGLISIICLIFIFIFVNRFAGPRIGLLSTLMISLTSQIIVTGITNITPGSLVFCYFLVLLCLIMHRERHINALLLCQFIMFIMIITHQLSTFVVLITLYLLTFSIFLFDHIYTEKNQNYKFLLFLALFSISMIVYWMYTPLYHDISFFKATVSSFIDVLLFTGGEYGSDKLIVGYEYVRPFYETFILQTSYLILPFFALGGIFFWLSRKESQKFSIAFTAGALFFLVYAIPFLGIRNLLTDRWMPFLIIFLGILAASYIISCIDSINSNTTKLVTIFAIVAIFSFLMITTPGINKDNPLVAKEETIRNQFTDNEIGAIERIKSIHGDKIMFDPSFLDAALFYGSDNTIKGQQSFYNSVVSFNSENELLRNSTESGMLIVLRKSTLNEPISLKVSELYGDIYAVPLSKTSFEYFEGSNNQNLVFTNGNVISYYSNR